MSELGQLQCKTVPQYRKRRRRYATGGGRGGDRACIKRQRAHAQVSGKRATRLYRSVARVWTEDAIRRNLPPMFLVPTDLSEGPQKRVTYDCSRMPARDWVSHPTWPRRRTARVSADPARSPVEPPPHTACPGLPPEPSADRLTRNGLTVEGPRHARAHRGHGTVLQGRVPARRRLRLPRALSRHVSAALRF